MKYILIIIVGLFLWSSCDDDETLVATTDPEFCYTLPQGDHDYDDKIVEWNKRCGFYFLYKFEPKDVFFNLDNIWAGVVIDTIYDGNGDIQDIKYNGINIEPGDEKYVGAQLAWIEEMFLSHYNDELLKMILPSKLILGCNLQRGGLWGMENLNYYTAVFNTVMFNYGDVSIETLSNTVKRNTKNDLNEWAICERLYNDYPDLEEFYAKTDYQVILDTKNDADGWYGLGCIISYPNFSTTEDAKLVDLQEYLKMIIKTSYTKLTSAPIKYDRYSGMLHQEKDVNGVIAEKYDILIRIFKEWGIDLQAIGNLYE